MTSALSTTSPSWLALVGHGQGVNLSPYAREIALLHTHVAGTSYIDLDELEPTLVEGLLLSLEREPGNHYDTRAILVCTDAGQKLGYLPRAKNEVLANLMDAGKPLFARITATNHHDSWLEIRITVLMRDL